MINLELPKIHKAIAYWHQGEVQLVLHGGNFTDDRRGTLTVAQALRLAEFLTRAARGPGVTDIVELLRAMTARQADPRWAAITDGAADEIERLRAALALGLRMQEAQKAYFKGRTKEALIASKEIGREFAQTARALLTGGKR